MLSSLLRSLRHARGGVCRGAAESVRRARRRRVPRAASRCSRSGRRRIPTQVRGGGTMPGPVIAAAAKEAGKQLVLSLLPELVKLLVDVLSADDPKEALVKARAAARMEAVKKTRGAAVRATR